MTNIPNLRATYRRQSTPGTLTILVCAIIVFGPKTWAALVGDSWVDNSMVLMAGDRETDHFSESALCRAEYRAAWFDSPCPTPIVPVADGDE